LSQIKLDLERSRLHLSDIQREKRRFQNEKPPPYLLEKPPDSIKTIALRESPITPVKTRLPSQRISLLRGKITLYIVPGRPTMEE